MMAVVEEEPVMYSRKIDDEPVLFSRGPAEEPEQIVSKSVPSSRLEEVEVVRRVEEVERIRPSASREAPHEASVTV